MDVLCDHISGRAQPNGSFRMLSVFKVNLSTFTEPFHKDFSPLLMANSSLPHT